ncbi:SAM-dependent methyltransferase [Streptomyces sp. 4N509B]|uniref:SAM-dependent methyltransferase n=1 Tax=Streptomyces sp. 4N509B TaxID=3457413 RepID=UPI003FD28403
MGVSGRADESGSASRWGWATADPGYAPAEVDTSRPSVARVYDACLGGKDNYAVDQAVVAELREVAPSAVAAAHVNRAFLVRGVRYLAEQGIDQFLDIGSGLPTAQNTHQVAQAVNPDARVVYVDNDPIVRAHGQALLARNDSTRVVEADLLDVEGVLGHRNVTGFLDFSRPVALLMLAVVHHVRDEDDPHGMVADYVSHLAPDSHLFLSHACSSFFEAPAVQEDMARAQDVMVRALGRGYMREEAEIVALFDGLDLLEPGVVLLPRWRPEGAVSEPLDASELVAIGGMARKLP